MEHVSNTLIDMRLELMRARDNEISMARDVLGQYVTDHNDAAAYRAIDVHVNQLAKAWDRLIDKLDKWHTEALRIEGSVPNFYGD